MYCIEGEVLTTIERFTFDNQLNDRTTELNIVYAQVREFLEIFIQLPTRSYGAP